MSEPIPGAPPRRRLYGRSKGRALRPHQARLIAERLPALEVDPALLAARRPLFAFEPRELWLEIGFGGGEHLAAQAAAHPDVGFIGCEPFVNGVAKALAAIERRGLENVRLRAGDARALIEALPPASLSRVFILYPDPWPKRRHHKRRVVCADMVGELARASRAGATVRFATDVDDYAGWTLARFFASPFFQWRAQSAADWTTPWDEWPSTRYEAKAVKAGRRPVYLTFDRL